MEWLNANFATIAVLLGVALGAGLTYLVQSRLLDKQREWELDNQKRERKRELDNQKREWKRRNLEQISERLNRYFGTQIHMLHILGASSRLGYPTISPNEYSKYRKDNEELGSRISAEIDFSIDPVLNDLYKNDWLKVVRETIGVLRTDERSQEAITAAISATELNFKFQRRITELVEDTYN